MRYYIFFFKSIGLFKDYMGATQNNWLLKNLFDYSISSNVILDGTKSISIPLLFVDSDSHDFIGLEPVVGPR